MIFGGAGALTCRGDVLTALNRRSDSCSGSCARLRFFRTFPLRVKGRMPPFNLSPVGAEAIGSAEGGGGGGGGGSMLTGLRNPF